MKIVLATLHAKYVHASLALPYLAAEGVGIPGRRTVIREYTVNEPQADVLRSLVDEGADVVAFSCYIWNVEAVARLASDLKKLRPETLLVAGGPEVSHTAGEFLLANGAFDCVIRGEGEKTWAEFLRIMDRDGTSLITNQAIPRGVTFRSADGIARTPDREPVDNLDDIPSPFQLGLVDLKKPLVYYETSRGCPFSCAFCLSSLEKGVRSFSPERIRRDLLFLMEQEVQVVKLVDRTFNYDPERADGIWNFIVERNRTSRFHFEIAADLLTEANLKTLKRAPGGMFRFEIGVQATGKETLRRVGRYGDTDRILAKVKRLRDETGVTVHLDLVAGLPGEDFRGFLQSLGRLFPVRPHHIQVEPLKVLKGSPMRAIADRENYAYSDTPPYKILRTPCLPFSDIGRIEGISRLLDLYYNSGRFLHSLETIGACMPLSHFFDEMERFTANGNGEFPKPLKGLFSLLWDFSGGFLAGEARKTLRDALCYDYCLVEYPSTGTLPDFFEDWRKENTASLSKDAAGEILGSVPKLPGARIRTYSGTFLRDYTATPPVERPTCLVFIYLSIPGQGMKVQVSALPRQTGF